MVTDWNEEIQGAIKQVIETTTAIIRKDGQKGREYCIYSKTGKRLGCYSTRKSAEKRLAEIEMFKHMK